jgi:hypothetical protein
MALSTTLAKYDKFARSKFEQPTGWPEGRKPGMVFVKAQEIGGIRVAFSLVSFFWSKNAPAFSTFATSLWLAKQKKETRLPVRQIGRIADLHAQHLQGEIQGGTSKYRQNSLEISI